jgi:hypothetical protein
MEELPSLQIFAAIVVPVVLISACGSLLISTAARLNRAVERVRKLGDMIEQFSSSNPPTERDRQKCRMYIDLMHRAARRSRLLEKAMISLYLAIGFFVLTCIAIGVDSLFPFSLTTISLFLMGLGLILLTAASLYMIRESYLADQSVQKETSFFCRPSGADNSDAV